jgi:hypothetical protein
MAKKTFFPKTMFLFFLYFGLMLSKREESMLELPSIFLAAIAALYMAMSVGRSVGWSVGWSVGGQRVLTLVKML